MTKYYFISFYTIYFYIFKLYWFFKLYYIFKTNKFKIEVCVFEKKSLNNWKKLVLRRMTDADTNTNAVITNIQRRLLIKKDSKSLLPWHNVLTKRKDQKATYKLLSSYWRSCGRTRKNYQKYS